MLTLLDSWQCIRGKLFVYIFKFASSTSFFYNEEVTFLKRNTVKHLKNGRIFL